MRMLSRISMLATLALGLGCSDASDSGTLTLDDISVSLNSRDGLIIKDQNDVILQSRTDVVSEESMLTGDAYAPFSMGGTSERDLSEQYGYYLFEDTLSPYRARSLKSVESEGNRLSFTFEGGGGGAITIEDDRIRVSWAVHGRTNDRLSMNFECEENDRFFGLGAHVSVEHRGYSIPIWVAEQGHGKVDRDETTPIFFLVGDHYTSYNPVPFALMNRPLGLYLDTNERSHYELCRYDGNLRLEVEGPSFDLVVYRRDSMRDTLSDFTEDTGRVEVPPRWNLAPVIDAGGGPDKVRQLAQLARDEGIPASAIWVEDWVGVLQAAGGEHLHYNWEVDFDMYPDFPVMTEDMAAQGLRFLTYVSPYIPSDTNAAQAGLEGGFVVKDSTGEPVLIEYPWGAPPYYFDIMAPDAPDWFRTFVAEADKLGIDGWMADFGEALPYDGRLGDGRTGKEAHNDYPRHWSSTNLEAWKALRPDDDFMLFTRSGYTGTAARTRIHWLGDQMSSYDRNDGFGSVIPLYISAGLSGIPLTHSDVGGYVTTIGHRRTPELWTRWLQLEAFTPVLRTHHGSNPGDVVQWYSTEDSRRLFKRYALWHQRLLPYFLAITEEASRTGHPTCRPIWWGQEEREDLFQIDTELLVGEHLLIAPILEEGGTSRDVVFPSRQWSRWMDFASPLEAPIQVESLTVNAELEEPILFVGPGAAIPMLAEDFDVLAAERDTPILSGIKVAPEQITRLEFLLTGGGNSNGSLTTPSFGETSWQWNASNQAELSLEGATVNNETIPDCIDAQPSTCRVDTRYIQIDAPSGNKVTVALGQASLTFESDTVTTLLLRIR